MTISKRVKALAAIGIAAAAWGGLFALGGCSGAPVADYGLVRDRTRPADLNDTGSRYALWTTVLHFKKEAGGEMTVTAATAEDPARTNVLRIAGQDHWYKTTAIQLLTAAATSSRFRCR